MVSPLCLLFDKLRWYPHIIIHRNVYFLINCPRTPISYCASTAIDNESGCWATGPIFWIWYILTIYVQIAESLKKGAAVWFQEMGGAKKFQETGVAKVKDKKIDIEVNNDMAVPGQFIKK